MEQLGLTPARLAELLAKELGEQGDQAAVASHLSSLTRVLRGETKSSTLVEALRRLLHLPEDDLERLYEKYQSDTEAALARVMAYMPTRAEGFMEDVLRLATLHEKIGEAQALRMKTAAEMRRLNEEGSSLEDAQRMLERHEQVKRWEAALERKLRALSVVLEMTYVSGPFEDQAK
jgi:hypothetical protein